MLAVAKRAGKKVCDTVLPSPYPLDKGFNPAAREPLSRRITITAVGLVLDLQPRPNADNGSNLVPIDQARFTPLPSLCTLMQSARQRCRFLSCRLLIIRVHTDREINRSDVGCRFAPLNTETTPTPIRLTWGGGCFFLKEFSAAAVAAKVAFLQFFLNERV